MLTELHHGMFEGYYWWEVIDKIPPSWRKKREDFETTYPGGGESMQMLIVRAWKGLSAILKDAKNDETIVMVSHQAVISAIRYVLLHGNPANIKTDSQIQDYLTFIHSKHLPNGGYVLAQIKNGLLQSIRIKKVFQPLKERKDNAVFYFKGIFQEKNKVEAETISTASENSDYVIKGINKHLLKIFHDKDTEGVNRQITLYNYLHSKNIPSPQIEFADTSKVFYKKPVFIQDFVEGEDQKVCVQMHSKKIKPVLKDIYKTVSQIHSLPMDEVKQFWYPEGEKHFRSWKPFMTFNINFTIHYARMFEISEEKRKEIINILHELRTYISEEKYSLTPIHGDLATGNIITTHKNLDCIFKRILDFDWARIGDKLWDYAYYLGWIERHNPSVAHEWNAILTKNLNRHEQKTVYFYRILFHAWTVRDMYEYKDSKIRARRGKQSLEILKESAL